MSRKSTVPYGHIAVPADVLATALYGLGQYEAAAIEARSDGLRPSTAVCKTVVWLWEDGHHREVVTVVGTACAHGAVKGHRRPRTDRCPNWGT